MKRFIILCFVLSVNFDTKAQENSLPFYIINIAALKSENEAKVKTTELMNKGYNSGYLWIPDYPSLSGAQFYSVYIGPYYNQYECEVATEEYRKKYPGAYGLLVSNESKRVQINGIGKVTVSQNTKKNNQNNYKKVVAEYTDFVIGDLEHWIFVADNGTEYDFLEIKDKTYELTTNDEINSLYKNKKFEILYKTEEVDFGTPGPGKQKIEVVYKLSLVK